MLGTVDRHLFLALVVAGALVLLAAPAAGASAGSLFEGGPPGQADLDATEAAGPLSAEDRTTLPDEDLRAWREAADDPTLDLPALLPGADVDALELDPAVAGALEAQGVDGPEEAPALPEMGDLDHDPVDAGDLVPEVDPDEPVVAAASGGTSGSSGNRTAHPTIVIAGDQGPTGFVLVRDPVTGTTVPRPGSGVQGGSGTADDPYVISGWNVSGIRITGTDAHVLVTDNRIREPPDELRLVPAPEEALRQETPVVLDDADNVTVAGNTIVDADDGDSAAVAARTVRNLTVTENDLNPTFEAGLALKEAGGVHVRNQTFEGHDVGVAGEVVDGLTVRNSTFRGLDDGVSVVDPEGVRLVDNDAAAVGAFAVLASDTDFPPVASDRDARVAGNLVDGAGIGVFLLDGVGAAVEDNTFADVEVGVAADASGGVYVLDNTLEGRNGTPLAGVYVDEAQDLAVERNTFDGVAFAALVQETDFPGFQGNDVRDSFLGIIVTDGVGGWFEGNSIEASGVGLAFLNVTEPQGPSNEIDGPLLGVVASDVEGGYVSDYTIRNATIGAVAAETTDLLLRRLDVGPEAAVGVVLVDAPRNHLEDSAFAAGGVYLLGDTPEELNQSIPPTNTLAGDPIRYVWNATDATMDLAGGQAVVAASRNVTVDAGNYTDAFVGTHVVGSRNVTLQGPAADDAFAGVVVQDSPSTAVADTAADGVTVGVAAIDSAGTVVRNASVDLGEQGVGVLAVGDDVAVEDGHVVGGDVGLLAADGETQRVDGLSAVNATAGAFLAETSNATVDDATFEGTEADALLWGNEDATLRRNAFTASGLLILGDREDLPGHAIPTTNTVQGEPLVYAEGAKNATVDGPAGQVVLLRPENVTVDGVDLQTAGYSVQAWQGRDLTLSDARSRGAVGLLAVNHTAVAVTNTTLESTEDGAVLVDVPDARFTGNTHVDLGNATTDPTRFGIVLDGPEANVTGNALDQGLLVTASDPNHTVEANTVEGEPLRYLEDAEGVDVATPAGQVVLVDTANVTVNGADVADAGIGVLSWASRNVTVTGTTVADDGVGVYAFGSGPFALEDTELLRNTWGAYLIGHDADADNVLADGDEASRAGISALAASLTLQGSTATDHGHGVDITFASANVTDTNLTDNRVGLDAFNGFRSVVAHGNNVEGNADAGADVRAPAANLTHNWWGCPGGPDEPACDDADVLGPVYPVLQAPNPEAGYDPTST